MIRRPKTRCQALLAKHPDHRALQVLAEHEELEAMQAVLFTLDALKTEQRLLSMARAELEVKDALIEGLEVKCYELARKNPQPHPHPHPQEPCSCPPRPSAPR